MIEHKECFYSYESTYNDTNSENADIKGFVENNTLLVNCHEDYAAFKGVDNVISQLKANITIADIYKEQFKNTT